MSAKTADTEEETLESPTPPKAAPISPDQREDEILEEDEDETEVFKITFQKCFPYSDIRRSCMSHY